MCREVDRDTDLRTTMSTDTSYHPPKDDLAPVGLLYLGMGYYLCIYKRDSLYTYWVLGGSNGYDAQFNYESFNKDTTYKLVPWEDLVDDIKKNYTIVVVL